MGCPIQGTKRFRVPQEYHSLHGKPSFTSVVYVLMNTQQFFGTKDGCLNQNCPFLHNCEAVLGYHAPLLKKRLQRLSHRRTPTWRQHVAQYHSVLDCISGGDKALRSEIEALGQVDQAMTGDQGYCTNLRCLTHYVLLRECEFIIAILLLHHCFNLNVRNKTGGNTRRTCVHLSRT
jgi:hypothetical protein